jgi:cell wall-associated NlpC family hydrolase
VVKRADIVAEALTWEGTPFKHQGRSRSGVDCVGLGICVGRAVGLLGDYDILNYRRNADGADLLREFKGQMGRQKPINHALPGDTFLFRDGQFVIHVGIVISVAPRLQIIHSYAHNKMVVKCYPDDTRDKQGVLSDRIQFCFEYPGVED